MSSNEDEGLSGWDAAVSEVLENEFADVVDQAVGEGHDDPPLEMMESTASTISDYNAAIPGTILSTSATQDSSPLNALDAIDSNNSKSSEDDDVEEKDGENESPWLSIAASSSSKGSQGSYADQVPSLSKSGSTNNNMPTNSELGSPWTLPDETEGKSSASNSDNEQQEPPKLVDSPAKQSVKAIKPVAQVATSPPSNEMDLKQTASKDSEANSLMSNISDMVSQFTEPKVGIDVAIKTERSQDLDDILGSKGKAAPISPPNAPVQGKSRVTSSLSSKPASNVDEGAAASLSNDSGLDDILGDVGAEAPSCLSAIDDVLGSMGEEAPMCPSASSEQDLDSILGSKGAPPPKSPAHTSSKTAFSHDSKKSGSASTRQSTNITPSLGVSKTSDLLEEATQNQLDALTAESFATKASNDGQGDSANNPYLNSIVAGLNRFEENQTKPVRDPQSGLRAVNSGVSRRNTFESEASSFQTTPSSAVTKETGGSFWTGTSRGDSTLSHMDTLSGTLSPTGTSVAGTSMAGTSVADTYTTHTFSPRATMSADGTTVTGHGSTLSPSSTTTSMASNSVLSPGNSTQVSRNDTFSPTSRNDTLSPTSRNDTLSPASRNDTFSPTSTQVSRDDTFSPTSTQVSQNDTFSPTSRNDETFNTFSPTSQNDTLSPTSIGTASRSFTTTGASTTTSFSQPTQAPTTHAETPSNRQLTVDTRRVDSIKSQSKDTDDESGGRLWAMASKEAEQKKNVMPISPEASRFAESLMSRTRSRAEPDAVCPSGSLDSEGKPIMIRISEQDERFFVATALARKRVRVVQLLIVGLIALLVAFLGTFWVQSSCHFVSASVEVGENSQIFNLHYGLWKYTPIDSAFQGYSFCDQYDDTFTSDAPMIPRIASCVSMVLGGFALCVLWVYLIFGRGKQSVWNFAVFTSTLSGILQLATLSVFAGPVCQRNECTLGPAGVLSVVSSMVYFVLAFEMHYNTPMAAFVTTLTTCPSNEQPGNMVAGLEMSDFQDGAKAYMTRIVVGDGNPYPSLNQVQRENANPIGEAMMDREYKPPALIV